MKKKSPWVRDFVAEVRYDNFVVFYYKQQCTKNELFELLEELTTNRIGRTFTSIALHEATSSDGLILIGSACLNLGDD